MHRTRSFTAEERATWVPLVAVLELLPKQLDTQLKRDEQLSHFDYFVLSLLALSDGRTLRMSTLAIESNATLPRLSHVVSRLEERGFVRRLPAPEDARATDVELTSAGRRKVIAATPGHVANVRSFVLDALMHQLVRQANDRKPKQLVRALIERLHQ